MRLLPLLWCALHVGVVEERLLAIAPGELLLIGSEHQKVAVMQRSDEKGVAATRRRDGGCAEESTPFSGCGGGRTPHRVGVLAHPQLLLKTKGGGESQA